jgi:hypothetical protein
MQILSGNALSSINHCRICRWRSQSIKLCTHPCLVFELLKCRGPGFALEAGVAAF